MLATFGVSSDAQVLIRDPSGQIVPLASFFSPQVKVGSETTPRFSWAVPREALHRGSVWIVSGTRHIKRALRLTGADVPPFVAPVEIAI
jgi:hypothetical protein